MKKFASILFIWIFGMGVFTFLLAMVFYNDPNIVWYSIPVGVLFAVINVAYLKQVEKIEELEERINSLEHRYNKLCNAMKHKL